MILMGLLVAYTRSMPQRRAFFVLYCLLITVTVSAIGCGGGSSPVVPKAQSYSVTVTATSGAITKAAQISLTVK